MPREIVGSKAFNLEYERTVLDQELRDDIVSYLGEYRLKVPKYDYQLTFSADPSGQEPLMLRDSHKGEAMRLKARRAIEEREERGDPTHREIAEEQGIEILEKKLLHSKTGDTVLWMSPPGPKEQGYDDYSFLFKGNVTKKFDGSASLAMQAIRLNKATLDQGREFFSTITDENVTHSTPEDFMANPVVLPFTIPDNLLDKTLKHHFHFEAAEQDKEKLQWVVTMMNQHIDEFIQLTKFGSKQQKLHAFYALENYAIKLDKDYDLYQKGIGSLSIQDMKYKNLVALTLAHGYTPPKTGGSCGSTSETKNNILQSHLQAFLRTALAEAIYGDEDSECESCGDSGADNHYHCPDCNKQYEDETNTAPDKRTAKCPCGFEFGCGEQSSYEEESKEVIIYASNN